MPDRLFTDCELKPTARTGTEYHAANGGVIKNLGEKTLGLDLPTGEFVGFQFQVGDHITSPLGSVSRITSRGNRVVFDDEAGSYIENKASHRKYPLRKVGGKYVLDAILRPNGQPFRRQGS